MEQPSQAEGSEVWKNNSVCQSYVLQNFASGEGIKQLLECSQDIIETSYGRCKDYSKLKKEMEPEVNLLIKNHKLMEATNDGSLNSKRRMHSAAQLITLKKIFLSDCKITIHLYERKFIVATLLNKLTQRMIELREESIACNFWPEGHVAAILEIGHHVDKAFRDLLYLNSEMKKQETRQREAQKPFCEDILGMTSKALRRQLDKGEKKHKRELKTLAEDNKRLQEKFSRMGLAEL